MAEEKLVEVENMRWEYREVATSHRFYVGLRFIIAAFTATLQSALLKIYSDALTSNLHIPDVVLRGYSFSLGSHPLSITIVGVLTIVAIIVMELRNIRLFRTMISRGKELELMLFLGKGKFHRLSEPKGFRLVAYTRGLMTIYYVIGAMWLYLLILNSITIYQRNF